MESHISGSGAAISSLDDIDEGYNAEDKELDVIDTDEINEISDFKQKLDDHDDQVDENEDSKKKTPVWKKPQKKKPAKKQDKNAGKQKQKQKQKPKANEPTSANGDNAQVRVIILCGQSCLRIIKIQFTGSTKTLKTLDGTIYYSRTRLVIMLLMAAAILIHQCQIPLADNAEKE